MDSMTAIRTFAKPGYTPTKGTRIFADRWYKVTMQNVERGQGDYMGLGEGEYTELVNGAEARARRDAHLNHCNHVEEWAGPVFELKANEYGGELRHWGYFGTLAELEAKLDERKAAHDKWIKDCQTEAGRHLDTADALDAGTGKSIMTAEHHRQCASDCMNVVRTRKNEFRCDAKRVR